MYDQFPGIIIRVDLTSQDVSDGSHSFLLVGSSMVNIPHRRLSTDE